MQSQSRTKQSSRSNRSSSPSPPSASSSSSRRNTTTVPVASSTASTSSVAAPVLNFAQLNRTNSLVGLSELRRVSSLNVLRPFAPSTTTVVLPPAATQWAADELAMRRKRTKKRSNGEQSRKTTMASAVATTAPLTTVVLPPTATQWAADELAKRRKPTKKRSNGEQSQETTMAAAAAAATTAPATMNVHVVRQSDALHKSELDALLRAMGDPNDHSDVVAEREVLLTVVLMQPNRDVRMIEIDVLAAQPLSALVDAFDCPSSRNAIALPDCRNQCMYIEGTFYDDTRHNDAVRYSEPLVQWLRECGDRVAPNVDIVPCAQARVANMQDTRLIDLELRLHAPYLYVHQGDCAHVFAFQAMRLACNVDPPRRSAYPRVVMHQLPRERRCAICEIYPAKYVTVADRWAPEDPCLFCERCYAPMHYDEHGDLLPNWQQFGGAEFVQDFAAT